MTPWHPSDNPRGEQGREGPGRAGNVSEGNSLRVTADRCAMEGVVRSPHNTSFAFSNVNKDGVGEVICLNSRFKRNIIFSYRHTRIYSSPCYRKRMPRSDRTGKRIKSYVITGHPHVSLTGSDHPPCLCGAEPGHPYRRHAGGQRGRGWSGGRGGAGIIQKSTYGSSFIYLSSFYTLYDER